MSNSAIPPASPARRELTPDQKRALATDCNVSVTAGAGSGKTTILVERYLKLVVEEGADVRQVLAITFTEKAAAEMLERLSRMISVRLKLPEYQHQRRKLLSLRERLSSAQISTIHSFCSRLLREFAVAAGIDPDFNIISDYQYQLLIDETLNELFSQLDKGRYQDVFPREEALALFRQVPPQDVRAMLNALLQTPHLAEQIGKQMGEGDEAVIMAALREQLLALLNQWVEPAMLLLKAPPLIQQIARASIPKTKLKEKGQSFFERLDDLPQRLQDSERQPEQWQALIDIALLLVNKEGQPLKNFSGLGLKADLKEIYPVLFELSELLHPLATFARECVAAAPGETDRYCLAAVKQVWQLYQITEKLFRSKKEERGFLDFEDLQILALRLIRDHEEVRRTLTERYRFIMVDEFQDTNDLQWELIERIGKKGDDLQDHKYFVVGDPKQSIYGFRNADVRVFQSVKQRFAGAAHGAEYHGEVVLSESFRFLPELNHFINYVFERIMGENPANEFEVPYEHLRTRRDTSGPAHIELALLNKEELAASGTSQEDYLCRRISTLLEENVRPGDIAVLIPGRTRLTNLEAAMRQYSIPFKTIGGIGFYRRQEVFDVYHLLRFLDDPNDDLALVALLRSQFAGVSDAALYHLALQRRREESYRQTLARLGNFENFPKEDRALLRLFRQQLSRWLARRDRLSLAKLLQEILDDSLYRAAAAADWNGEQLLANLDKIVEMVRDFEQAGFTALGDFIDRLHELIVRDPREGEAQVALEDAGTVKIMTIHQAKGLEFPIVFCPYLENTPRSSRKKHRLDMDGWLACKLRDPADRFREKKPFLYHWISYRNRIKEAAERKRLLYVAITRARDQIYLAGAYKNDLDRRPNALSWLAEALQLDPGNPQPGPLSLGTECQVEVVWEMPDDRRRTLQRSSLESSVARLSSIVDDPPRVTRLPIELQAVQDFPGGVAFSATQLMTFERSEEEYFRRYHLGFFESDYEFIKHLSGEDNRALLKGKIVHLILENGLPQHPAQLEDALEQAFFRYEIFDPDEQETLRIEIPGLLEKFKNSNTAKRVFSAPEWRSELSLTMSLGEDFFTGALDRVFRNAGGLWEVIDYKTNNISPGQVEKTAQKYRLQMQSYALLTAQLFPGQSGYPVSLYFLKPGELYTHCYTPEEIDRIRAYLLELIDRIKQYYPFPGGNTPSPPDRS